MAKAACTTVASGPGRFGICCVGSRVQAVGFLPLDKTAELTGAWIMGYVQISSERCSSLACVRGWFEDHFDCYGP